MTKAEFEKIVEESFESLPENFQEAIENVGIVVEDYPDSETVKKMGLRSKHDLLGLYQGIPLTARGTWYGMAPALPDTIHLYQKNIEAVSARRGDIREKIREVLIHEIGHYFGMDEDEIREAGY